MKKLGLVLFILAFMVTSCDKYYYGGTIYQEVTTINKEFYLSTTVNYDGNKVLHHLDKININNLDDVELLKKLRYKEAIKLIDKLEVIAHSEVSKK